MPEPYELSARLYDRIYSAKDYKAEAAAVRGLVELHRPGAASMLEVGCGTGGHLVHFREWFEVEGVDLSPAMLAIAREKLAVPLHRQDMRTFALPRRFDVVACLFSSIGYVRSVDELDQAIANLARHLLVGGMLVVEPWFTPEQWRVPGSVRGEMVVDEENLKVARFVVSEVRGRFAVTPMHHLVAEPTGVTHFVERHELLLATAPEYEHAFVAAGLVGVHFLSDVLPRGAWVGFAPSSEPARDPERTT